jgi:hypothetical protein
MSADLDRDLGAWEAGELDRDELTTCHGKAAGQTAAFHERVEHMVHTQFDHERLLGTVWSKVDDAVEPTILRRRGRKTTVLALAATLLLGGSAFAAVGTGLARWTRGIRDATPSPPTMVVGATGHRDPATPPRRRSSNSHDASFWQVDHTGTRHAGGERRGSPSPSEDRSSTNGDDDEQGTNDASQGHESDSGNTQNADGSQGEESDGGAHANDQGGDDPSSSDDTPSGDESDQQND